MRLLLVLVPLLLLAILLPLSAAFITTHSHRTRTIGFAINENDNGNGSGSGVEEVGVLVAGIVHPYMALVIPRGVRNMTTRGSAFILDPSEIDTNSITDTDAGIDIVGGDRAKDCLYLLTAAHVAAPGMDIDIRFARNGKGDETIRGTLLGRNQTLDLALFKTAVPSTLFDDSSTISANNNNGNQQFQGLKLATCLPLTGTRTFAHGFPASRLRGPAMTSGIVCGIADGLGVPQDQSDTNTSSKTDIYDATTFVVTDAAMSPGMSGGPLTDQYGKVLGINALVRPDLRALGNYAVSSEEIRHFLQHDCKITRPKEGNANCTAATDKSANVRHKVLLFNDPMNKRERVSKVLCEVAKLGQDDADKAMMAAHRTGMGMVKEFEERDEAESLCQALKKEDLLVEVETFHLPHEDE